MVKRKRGICKKFSKVFTKKKSYLNIIYLLLLFPLGVISFTLIMLLIPTSLAFIVAPITAPFSTMNFGFGEITNLSTKMWIAVGFSIVGILLLKVSFHLMNGVAFIYKKILSVFEF